MKISDIQKLGDAEAYLLTECVPYGKQGLEPWLSHFSVLFLGKTFNSLIVPPITQKYKWGQENVKGNLINF